MHIPAATYRLQLTPSFDLEEARAVVSYLADLGISDLYLSPVFRAVAGSTHGYDIVDPTEINPELGGLEKLHALSEEAKRHGMSLLQDIVPNHMAFDTANRMLMDVLENGPGSRYVDFFDIDWDHFYESLRGRLLAPFLGNFYGEALEAGDIKLAYSEEGITVNYYELRLPLRIESYAAVLSHNIESLERTMGEHHPDLIKFIGTVHTLAELPAGDRVNERYEQIRFTRRMLFELYSGSDQIRSFIDNNIAVFNGEPGRPDTFNLLDNLLSQQHFRLSFWKVATEEINYRRFFTINNLICLRLEDDAVFDHTHRLIAELVKEGVFSGLRVDHIDGLHDPAHYLARLRDIAPEAYLVVEKILEDSEELPASWPVAGTTGYDFMNMVSGVLCDRTGERPFNRLYSKFARMRQTYEQLVAEKKRLIIDKHLAGNIDDLAHLMKRISDRDRHGNDITLYGLRSALVELLAYFPVYRTYITSDSYTEADRAAVSHAITRAVDHHPGLLHELNFIRKFLRLEFDAMATDKEREQAIDFVMRFQQVSGPLMAKGVEDTTMYVYNRLLSLNEVGGAPDVFGRTRDEFHEFNRNRARSSPNTLNATATHDHKRGEDARARLNVLTEIPEEWEANIALWRRINRRRKTVRGVGVPDKNDEYFLYQAILASWPLHDSDRPAFIERVKEYVIKAIREAKVHTAWLKPDEEYENAYLSFVDHILRPEPDNHFLESLAPFAGKVAWFGMINSLSQVLLKITSPGVPDFYRGTELWDLSMVDPDNRRPVDFAFCREALASIHNRADSDTDKLIEDLIGSWRDGRVKLYVTWAAMQARRHLAEPFDNGEYIPLTVEGARAEHLVAFARRRGRSWAITVAPRFPSRISAPGKLPLGESVWEDTRIKLPVDAPAQWSDEINRAPHRGGSEIRAADLFSRLPLALLTGKEAV